jgi:hypothetical protein
MAITKNVSFAGPYVGKTFQDLAKSIVGRDGYLGGAGASDDGTNITLGPYAFIQGGVVCAQDAVSTLRVPLGPEPWFVTVSAIDDDPSSGVALQATNNASQVGAAVVLAYKMNGHWYNPLSVTVEGVRQADRPDEGREAGFRTTAAVSGGTVSSFQINRGRAIDADGERRALGGAQGAAIATFAPLSPGARWGRNDYLILRKREVGSEIVLAQGNAIGGVVDGFIGAGTIESGPLVTRPAAFAKRGAGFVNVAFAWGNGTGLRLFSALELATSGTGLSGFFGPITVYTGNAPIRNVSIIGQRGSDRAILIAFTEGQNVKIAAFSAADGSIVNAPVRIDQQPNACIRVRAKVDLDEYLHVVYQHDEGGAPPNQQIYYTKCSLASGHFGAAAITPRLVNGVNSTRNDTWPSVNVDRHRRAHIAYSTGVGANEFGQLRYAIFDQNGNAVSRTTYATFGHQLDPTSPEGIVDGTSLIDNVQRPQVVVTPHDEVNIFMLAKRVAYSQPDQIAVFNPTFEARLGFPMAVLSGLYPGSGKGTDALVALGATSDELGQLLLVANWSTAGLLYARLDTILAPFGVLGDSYLEQPITPLAQLGNTDPELVLVRGPSGDLIFGALNGTTPFLGLSGAKLSGRPHTPHPHDVYLSGWEVDTATREVTTLSLPEQSFQIFHTRPKKMSYPILVGDEGDYQGYGALTDALTVANRVGGHVVVRGGSHRPIAPIVLRSGVRLEGEGNVTLDFSRTASAPPPDGWVQLGTMPAPLSCVVSQAGELGSVVALAGASPLRANIRTGDLCEFVTAGTSSGLFRVRRILDDARFAVDGSPSGSQVVIYACGVEFKNVSLLNESIQSAPLIMAKALYGGLLERVKVSCGTASGVAALRMSYCRESTARQIDVLGSFGAQDSFGVQIDFGTDNVVDRALLGDGGGRYLKIDATTQNPHVLNCSSSSSDQARYQVDGPRATPLFMSACSGRVDGDVSNVVTHVGKVLSSVKGRSGAAGALQFQDDNTVQYQAGQPLDLTAPSAAGSRFNGATPRVIVPSVNERILRSGDTMTGELGVVSLALSEISNPATPAVGTVRLYLRSNGQAPGQTPPVHRSQLVMLMPDGNTVVIAQTDLS